MFEAGMVQTLVEGVRDTLYMVLASTAFGYLLGLPLGILLCITGENGIRKNPVIYRILDIVVNLIRSVPFLILLILVSPFTKWLVGKSYGATATVVSLVIAAAPFIARMVESSLNEVDQGVIEAAKSMGATDGTIIWKVLIGEAQNVAACRRDHRARNDSRVLRDGGCARRRRSRRYRHPLRLLPLAGRRDVGHGHPARCSRADSAGHRHAAVQEARPQKTLTPRFSIVFVGAGDSARPWESQSKSPKIPGKIGTVRRADRVVRPYGFSESSERRVGVDAHIDPAVQTDFTKIQCESDGALGAMWASPPTRFLEICTAYQQRPPHMRRPFSKKGLLPMNPKKEAFRKAFIASVPILCSYLFLGMAYGILMQEAGLRMGGESCLRAQLCTRARFSSCSLRFSPAARRSSPSPSRRFS